MHQTSAGGAKLARRVHGGKTPSASVPAAGISDIVDAAAETKLLSRNPESFQSAVDAMAGDAGVSHVTMDGDGVAKVLSQPDIDAPSLMRKMPSLAQELVQSLLHGDPIRIPFGEYVTALAAANDNVKGAMLEHVASEPAVRVAAEGGVRIGTPDTTSTDQLLDNMQRQGELSPVDAALLRSNEQGSPTNNSERHQSHEQAEAFKKSENIVFQTILGQLDKAIPTPRRTVLSQG